MSCYLVFANFDTLRFLSVFGFQGTNNSFHNATIFSDIAHGYRGDKGIRTLDPLLARQVLSQLSYTPIKSGTHLLSHIVSNIVSSAA